MKMNRPTDDLTTMHLYLNNTLGPVLRVMPEFFTVEVGLLHAYFTEILGTSKARTCVGVKKATDLAHRKAWTYKADDLISRTKLFLRATVPELVRDYLPENTGTASRKIDRLHILNKVLTVSEHFGHAHLGAFEPELEALVAEGSPIFDAASASVVEQKTEVEKLKELKLKWENQYQKIKFLVRGYYYNSSTDWTKFFDEKRAAKSATVKEEAQKATAIAPAVDLAS